MSPSSFPCKLFDVILYSAMYSATREPKTRKKGIRLLEGSSVDLLSLKSNLFSEKIDRPSFSISSNILFLLSCLCRVLSLLPSPTSMTCNLQAVLELALHETNRETHLQFRSRPWHDVYTATSSIVIGSWGRWILSSSLVNILLHSYSMPWKEITPWILLFSHSNLLSWISVLSEMFDQETKKGKLRFLHVNACVACIYGIEYLRSTYRILQIHRKELDKQRRRKIADDMEGWSLLTIILSAYFSPKGSWHDNTSHLLGREVMSQTHYSLFCVIQYIIECLHLRENVGASHHLCWFCWLTCLSLCLVH